MRVLLVDHDSEGLETIARAIRGVLELDCVTSKGDAMLLLRQNAYDVLIACERCVDGSGLDLLGRTTRTAAPLKRIFSAPPDRLQLLGPRLAPFKVQRTINYPIDLEELWLAIAQVTGTNDETDGTIERVVLDERGIPANGSTPRAPIPPRPPAPLREVRPMAVAAPAVAAGAGRTAAARAAAPTPEPVVRAVPPPPPRVAPVARPAAPAATSETGRMRALAAQPVQVRVEPTWVVEAPEDDFAQVAAQARLGVQSKAMDEAARRKRQKLITAGAVATAVAGVLVFLIEKFYDPGARAKEAAIAAEVMRMAEEQKVTDNLTLIEIDIEKAIMDNNLDVARVELARLVQQSPEHPRREFLQASIDRAAELTKLSAQNASAESRDTTGNSEAERAEPVTRSRPVERTANRVADRTSTRTPERSSPPAQRQAAAPSRSFGAPIGESPSPRTIPLDAPINSEPTLAANRRSDNSFAGRTVEASDSAVGRSAANVVAASANQNSAGSAVATPPVAPAPAALDVTPAKVVKRVAPVAPAGVPLKTAGFVVVKFNITENGKVADVEVVESSPSGVFDTAAQSAVRKWIYEPRKENGVAVTSSARARLVFEPAD